MLIATFVPSVPVEATRPQQPPLASMTRRKAAQQWTPGGVPVNNTRATFKPPNNNPTASKKQPRFYAVRVGRNGFQGILQSWDACRPYVSGFSGATFKSFKTAQEARQYIQITPVTNQTNATPQKPPHTPKPKGIPPQPVSRPQPGLLGIDSPDFNDSRASLNELLASTRPEELAANAPIPSDEALPEMSVYTDGACSNNGKPNARAGYGVYFGKESPYNVSKPLKDNPTNQRAEMTAVLEAMRLTLDHGLVATGGTLSIYTDSKVSFLLSKIHLVIFFVTHQVILPHLS